MRILLFIFGIAFWSHSVVAYADTALSNLLPKALVQQLIEESLWRQSFDEASDESRDLIWFWQEIQPQGKQEVEDVVDQLFGHGSENEKKQNNRDLEIRLPRLYPVKIHFLRYVLENQSQSRTRKVSEAWMRRYLEMALVSMDMANVADLKPITEQFREKLKRNEIKIADLSPRLREQIKESIPEEHGADILAREPKTKKFLISGLYNESKKFFALDFARSLEETLITFAHEMIHAADPSLEKHRTAYKTQTDQVHKILVEWLDGAPEAQDLALDIIDHVFFETGLHRFKDLADSIREKRKQGLRESIRKREKEEPPFEPSEAELEIIQGWMRAAIGLTVENEYRAYGYSLLLYAVLKSRFQMLPPSKERLEYIDKFLAGDDVMATHISVSMNPFLRARSSFFQKFLKPSLREQNMDARTKFFYLRVGKVLDQLELSYLEETEKFLRGLNDKMAEALRQFSSEDLRAPSVLPDWAQPGGFDLPSNPFQILTARITTAWVLRFRQNMDLFYEDIRSINEPLQSSRFGVLDLSDLSLGERKLIGINYENSPWTHQPKELEEKLQKDLDSIPLNIAKYFALAGWSPDNLQTEVLDGKALDKNLLRLRALKATAWLDQSFPTMKNSVLGIRSFLQRLREGIFHTHELSPARVKELQEELLKAYQVSELNSSQLVKMHYLMSDLALLQNIATEGSWVQIGGILDKKIRFALQTLDSMGVYAKDNKRTLLEADQKNAVEFLQDLKPSLDACKKITPVENRLGGFWPTKGPFRIGEHSFPLMILCYKRELYLVRMPGDYLHSMTSMVRNGAPEVRIFMGARPLRLYPMPPISGGKK